MLKSFQIVSAKLWAKGYLRDLASQKAMLMVSRLSISVLVQSVNYADWFVCLKPLEEIWRALLEYKWRFMLRSLMGQRECVFHAFIFFPLRMSMWRRRDRGLGSESNERQAQIKTSTLQSSQHCPCAHTASSLRVQVVALQHGFTHSWNTYVCTHTHKSK